MENRALLHNMSAPPKTVVIYHGLGACPDGASGGRNRRSALFGTTLRFCLPRALRPAPKAILRELGCEPGVRPGATLSRLVDERAGALPLPDGCAVLPSSPEDPVLWPDLLTALAILTKCSASVWLRSKTPSLQAAFSRREVSLLVPAAFAAGLSEYQP